MLKHAVLVATAAVAMLPVAANAGEVQNRLNTENARINQGLANGSLARGQYNRIDHRLDTIQWQRNRDLRSNDGRLTPREYTHLNREENHVSARIYHAKHT